MINDHQHKLSIRVSLDGFSFYISSKGEASLAEERHFPLPHTTPHHLLEQLKAEMIKEPLIQERSFRKINVIHQNQLFSLVPNSYFDAENASAYLQYNTKILKTDFIAHDHIVPHGLVNVYIPFTNINNYIFEKFGEFSYYHHLSLEIDKMLSKPVKTEPLVVLNKHDNLLDIVAIDKDKLLLANCFDYDTDEDVLYYTLFVLEQLDLDPDRTPLEIQGISEADATYGLLYKYIRNVTIQDSGVKNTNKIL